MTLVHQRCRVQNLLLSSEHFLVERWMTMSRSSGSCMVRTSLVNRWNEMSFVVALLMSGLTSSSNSINFARLSLIKRRSEMLAVIHGHIVAHAVDIGQCTFLLSLFRVYQTLSELLYILTSTKLHVSTCWGHCYDMLTNLSCPPDRSPLATKVLVRSIFIAEFLDIAPIAFWKLGLLLATTWAYGLFLVDLCSEHSSWHCVILVVISLDCRSRNLLSFVLLSAKSCFHSTFRAS
jgi:hypothetical protein